VAVGGARVSEQVPFGDWSLYAAGFDEAADLLVGLIRDAGAPTVVVHVNAYNAFRLSRDAVLRERLATDACLVLDGIGMKLAARGGLGRRVPDLNGTDLFPLVMARTEAPVFLIGATTEVVAATAEQMRRRWPSVPVVGARDGFDDCDDEPSLVAEVAASGARWVLVARGCPLQERFALRLRAARPGRVSLVWTVGGLFDFVSGGATRAPAALRAARLEWAFRWAREPRRMLFRNAVIAPWLAARIVAARRDG